MTIEFEGRIWFWKGPAPHHFVSVPPELGSDLRAISGAVTYGWGMIPVRAHIGDSAWDTSLFPKDGSYIVPIRASIRTAEQLGEGDLVTIRLDVR
jgi:hypothetical protein